MVIDGSDGDWGWIDSDFIITPDELFSSLGELADLGADPNPEDWSGTFMMAWTPPPDNSLYLFSRVTDDTLRSGESEVKRNWWNDDSLQFDMDMDHTGGPMSWTSTEDTRNGYRIQMHPQFDEQLGATISIDFQEPGFEDWGALPPHAFTATTLLPADASYLSANVEYTYEMRVASPMVTYDILGPDVSTPHVFEPDQIIHLKASFFDGDRDANGQLQSGSGVPPSLRASAPVYRVGIPENGLPPLHVDPNRAGDVARPSIDQELSLFVGAVAPVAAGNDPEAGIVDEGQVPFEQVLVVAAENLHLHVKAGIALLLSGVPVPGNVILTILHGEGHCPAKT